MPGDFPRSPTLVKGALVAYDQKFLGPIPNIIVFQYNPDELSRTLTHRNEEARDGQTPVRSPDGALKVTGPPVEAISLKVEVDATDQLEGNNPLAMVYGVHPTLAALEMLLYPPSSQIFLNETLAGAGTSQITPEYTPLVLFVWGYARVVPVRLQSFSIRETAFDTFLNPIRAEVTLGMKVLTYLELSKSSLGYQAYLATQVQKEVNARLNLINSAGEILGMLGL